MNSQRSVEFGQRIARYRSQRGWTQTRAAEVMGVQRTSLNRWENGKEMPCGENMTKLRDHLKMPIGTEEEPPEPSEMHQLALPFEPPLDLEFRVTPKGPDTVQFEVRLKQAAG